MDGADLGAVAELERGGDQADDQRGGQFVDAVSYTHLTLPTSDLV